MPSGRVMVTGNVTHVPLLTKIVLLGGAKTVGPLMVQPAPAGRP